MKLKQHRFADPGLRIPGDLELYANKERTRLIERSKKYLVIDFVDHETKIFLCLV